MHTWKNFPARKLPEVSIGGILFYLDTRLGEFREVENFMNKIDLDDFYWCEQGMEILFDRQAKSQYTGTEDYDSNPNVSRVVLPHLEEMDPVGFKALYLEFLDKDPREMERINQLIVEKNYPRENDTRSIGDLLQKQKPPNNLIEKRQRTNYKGKRL